LKKKRTVIAAVLAKTKPDIAKKALFATRLFAHK
jgi:hypothetical protein